MKKILAILVVIFMHLSAIPQDGTSWVQQYLVLFQQIANAEDENKITEIAQQLIDLFNLYIQIIAKMHITTECMNVFVLI